MCVWVLDSFVASRLIREAGFVETLEAAMLEDRPSLCRPIAGSANHHGLIQTGISEPTFWTFRAYNYFYADDSRGPKTQGYGQLTCCWRDPMFDDLEDSLFLLGFAQKYCCSAIIYIQNEDKETDDNIIKIQCWGYCLAYLSKLLFIDSDISPC